MNDMLFCLCDEQEAFETFDVTIALTNIVEVDAAVLIQNLKTLEPDLTCGVTRRDNRQSGILL